MGRSVEAAESPAPSIEGAEACSREKVPIKTWLREQTANREVCKSLKSYIFMWFDCSDYLTTVSLVYNYYKGAFAACAKVVCMSGLCLGKHFYHRCLNTIDSFFVLYVTDGILSWKTLQNNS